MTDHDLDQIRQLIRSELAESREDIKEIRSELAESREDIREIRSELAESREDLREMRTDFTTLKAKVDSWPDLHFLQASAQRQQREVNEAREHRRYIEIKLGEIYGAMATSSEITKLREEVSSSIAREDQLDLRISAIEMRLGIKKPSQAEAGNSGAGGRRAAGAG